MCPRGRPRSSCPWLRGDVRPPAVHSVWTQRDLVHMQGVIVTGLTSFWQDERLARLTEATRIVIEGIGRLGWGMVLRAQVEDGVLRYLILADGPAAAVAASVRAAFEDAEVKEVARGGEIQRACDSAWAVQARRALAGVPVNAARASKVTLLERLMRSGALEWSLTVTLALAPTDALRARYEHLGQLRSKAETLSRREVQVTATTSEREIDPVAEVVAELLASEEDRTLKAMRTLAFVGQIWLEGPDASVDGLAAIAAASLAGDQGVVFPVRILKESRSGAPPAVLLLPSEVATIIQPPATDVRGLPVTRWMPMDREPEPIDQGGALLRLGLSAGGAPLDYPADALTAHALISGATGSGKSSFLMALLHELRAKAPGVSFLVIEPAKDEYQHLDIPGLRTWRMGAPDSLWRLNPMEVPEGTSLSTHVDLLLALFASTFALFPPLPYVLEMALRRCYEEAGWDFRTGRHRSGGDGLFPTLSDLAEAALATVDDLGYSGEVLHNVSAALRARLGSLVHGVKGELLDTDDLLDIRALLTRPTIVNLDLVGNDREKAFLMGLLLIRLWEARRGKSSRSLVHLTVVEEAHRILREPKVSTDGAGGQGDFAAETFANMLAEVRAAGEGLVIVDQSPRRLVRDVLTNCALKVALRTLGPDDRSLLADALNIEGSAAALTVLANHHALVFWEGMDRPVRARLSARHPSAKPRVRSRTGGSSATAPSVRDEAAVRLADSLLRVRATERTRIWQLLVRRLGAAVGDDASAEAVARDMVAAAASRLARRRGWSRADRDALVAEAVPGAGQAARAAQSGGRDWGDESTCRCVGGPGTDGCRLAEPVRSVARAVPPAPSRVRPDDRAVRRAVRCARPLRGGGPGDSGRPIVARSSRRGVPRQPDRRAGASTACGQGVPGRAAGPPRPERWGGLTWPAASRVPRLRGSRPSRSKSRPWKGREKSPAGGPWTDGPTWSWRLGQTRPGTSPSSVRSGRTRGFAPPMM